MLRGPFSVILFLFCFGELAGQSNATDSLIAIVAKNNRDSAHIHALGLLGEQFRVKDKSRSMYYFREIVRLGDINPSMTLRAYVALALRHSDNANPDSATYCFDQAMKIAEAYPKDKSLLASLHNGLGLFYKKLGNNEKSLQSYFLVESLGEAVVGKENIAGNFLNIANTYNRMGNRKEGIRFLYKALRAFESIPNEKGISYCYNSLGSLLKQQGQLKEAEFYLKKSLEMKENEGDLKGIGNTCNELALLSIDLNDLDKALRYVDRAIPICEKLGAQEGMITGMVHKGKILRLMGETDKALSILQKARPMAESLENQFVLSQLELEIGKVYSIQKKGDEAVATLLSSIDMASRTQNLDALADAHRVLAEEFTKAKKFKEALEQYQHFHQLNDSLRGSQLKLDYKRLETQYEVEKKNAEIALLKKDQELQAKTAQRQRAVQSVIAVALVSVVIISVLLVNRYRVINRSKRLLEIERVRNTIARDLHDDIGSTLSSINIVSRLGQQRGDATDSGEHFRKIAEHSSALMERMSDIVWSINPANDSLSMMVAKMKEFSAEILEPKNIQYSFHGVETLNGETLDVDKRRNIFLVFKEAVNNAAKYSGSTQVDIEIRQKHQSLFLGVRDNGKGFDPKNGRKGNGLRNMEERARAINATFGIQSGEGKGTEVALTIPLT